MKKSMVALLLSGIISGAASAQSVSSANIVGYNQITIPSNDFALISTSFINDSNTVEGLFGDLPTGSTVYMWDTSNQRYNTFGKTRSGWGDAGTNILNSGSGAFVKLPAGVQTNVIFSGDVPVDGEFSVYTANGLTLMSYPYSADVAFTNTTLAKDALVGDSISFWDNGWVTYGKTRSGWSGVDDVKLELGQAFFYRSTTNAERKETRPYQLD